MRRNTTPGSSANSTATQDHGKRIKSLASVIKSVLLGALLLIFMFLLPGSSHSDAAGYGYDLTSPYMKVTPNTRVAVQELKLTLKTSDESGIEEVRWDYGAFSAAHFQNGAGTVLTRSFSGSSALTVTQNGSYTFFCKDAYGNSSVITYEVTNIDSEPPVMILTLKDSSDGSKKISVRASDDRAILDLRWLKGYCEDPELDIWEEEGYDITGLTSFSIEKEGVYSVRAQDLAGNSTIRILDTQSVEFRAVWVSYLEFSKNGYSDADFQTYIDTMFDNIASMNMNAVVVQVRPFGDAMYDSDYFPWSVYASGTQGKDPGYDPLEYMVKAAHARGLQLHAWLNPYRITNNTTDYTTLSADNPARIWLEDNDTSNDRNVLSYDGKLYYNPAVPEVRELILNGVTEIAERYEVDGIHFDDYFYPSLGSNYKTNFDYLEYNSYQKKAADGDEVMDIADWRRNNVNILIHDIYAAIKEIDDTVEFGISPGGYIDYLSEDTRFYVDYETWMSEPGYIDYICPQIYWSFSHSKYPFDTTLNRWLSCERAPGVKVYVGIAAYKAGMKTEESDWYKDSDVLRNQVLYGRENGVDGFLFFRYAYFYNSTTQEGIERLLDILGEEN